MTAEGSLTVIWWAVMGAWTRDPVQSEDKETESAVLVGFQGLAPAGAHLGLLRL